MSLSLAMVTVDSTDPAPLALWWAEQTDASIAQNFDDWFLVLAGGGLPMRLAFQKVDEVTPGKNKLHLDLSATDPDAEVERLVAAGATLVAEHGDEGFAWTTLADPQGNQFCVSSTDH